MCDVRAELGSIRLLRDAAILGLISQDSSWSTSADEQVKPSGICPKFSAALGIQYMYPCTSVLIITMSNITYAASYEKSSINVKYQSTESSCTLSEGGRVMHFGSFGSVGSVPVTSAAQK